MLRVSTDRDVRAVQAISVVDPGIPTQTAVFMLFGGLRLGLLRMARQAEQLFANINRTRQNRVNQHGTVLVLAS